MERNMQKIFYHYHVRLYMKKKGFNNVYSLDIHQIIYYRQNFFSHIECHIHLKPIKFYLFQIIFKKTHTVSFPS
jgi:hypothetical protein